ncbi:hypothetical protein PAMP_001909 [Pampus punctatissimus]
MLLDSPLTSRSTGENNKPEPDFRFLPDFKRSKMDLEDMERGARLLYVSRDNVFGYKNNQNPPMQKTYSLTLLRNPSVPGEARRPAHLVVPETISRKEAERGTVASVYRPARRETSRLHTAKPRRKFAAEFKLPGGRNGTEAR